MELNKRNIKVDIYVNPLGNAYILWEIPVEYLKGEEKIRIGIPSYKFDLPRIATVPVPLSSKALIIETVVNDVKLSGQMLKHEILDDNFGNKSININLNELIFQERDALLLNYVIKDIVNNDGIFFVFVYPFSNIFPNARYDISVKAKFSYVIRRYKFREWYFSLNTGKKITYPLINTNKKIGDTIFINLKNLSLDHDTELDIHLTGTRLFITIRRDYFWLIIFIISLIIILSPIWSNLIFGKSG